MKRDFLVKKAYGCLAGVAVGDAMGMPTSLYTPEQIEEKFGYVEGFLPAPEDHIIHKGMKAGEVTDDTQITLVIAETIIEDRKITPEGVAKRLVDWAIKNKVIGTDLIGPSTSKALEKLMKGSSPKDAGRLGMTNGAAMRISPVGIFNAGNVEKTVEDTEKACIPTHGTSIAISAACAVACAIAEAMKEKSSISSVLKAAKKGARIGEKKGLPIPSASIEKRIELALSFIKKTKDLKKISRYLYDYIGCGVASNESIPTSIALFAATQGEPMKAIITATNIGGDTDTIASIVGGICGAYKGINAFSRRIVEEVEKVNNIDLFKTAEDLISVR